jgi:hypothetical protein
MRDHVTVYQSKRGTAMADSHYERIREELDLLLNDPDTPMQPDRVWVLTEALACESAEPERLAA